MTGPGVLALFGLVTFYVLGAYLSYQFMPMSKPKPNLKQYVPAGVLGFIATYALMLPIISAALTLHSRGEEIQGLSLSIALLVAGQGIGLPLVIKGWI